MENCKTEFQLDLIQQEKNISTNQTMMLIKHPTVYGEGTAETRVPRALLTNTSKLSEKLVEAGAPIIENLKSEAIRLSNLKDRPTIKTTDLGDWHGDTLVTRHGVFTEEGADCSADVYQFNADNPLFCPAKEKGTYAAYMRGLKQPLAYSRYLQFITAVALAAPLGAFLGREGGPAFNLSGKSSRGKTLSLLTNLSIVTEPTEASLLSLASTPTFFINSQMSFRGTSVAFSDMKTFMGSKEALFDVLRLIIFNNHDRPTRHTALSSNVRETGFSIPLFSSESPLKVMFDSKKFALEGGELVRLIDIPVPGDTGIFDKIPHGKEVSPSELASTVSAVIKENYGHCLPFWIDYLVTNGRDDLKTRVEKMESKFLEKVSRNANKNGRPLQQEEYRIAKSFALVAAAGFLAAEGKILPIDRKVIGGSIVCLFQRSINSMRSPEDVLWERIESFKRFATCSGNFPFVERGVEVQAKDVPNGFLRSDDGQTFLFVYPDAMNGFHGGDEIIKDRIYRYFRAKGALIKKQPDEWTVPVQQKGLGKVRMLKFVLSRIGD